MKEVGLIDFNWRFLFILLLGTAVGVMSAIKRHARERPCRKLGASSRGE